MAYGQNLFLLDITPVTGAAFGYNGDGLRAWNQICSCAPILCMMAQTLSRKLSARGEESVTYRSVVTP